MLSLLLGKASNTVGRIPNPFIGICHYHRREAEGISRSSFETAPALKEY
jgi:hypothetical protein